MHARRPDRRFLAEHRREHPFAAAAAAAAALGVAGELAEAHRLRSGAGNASFRTHLIDGVFRLTETQLREGVRYEVYQG